MLPIECSDPADDVSSYLTARQTRGTPWNSLSGSKLATATKAELLRCFHSKCGYCEKIEANSVDHFLPKERFSDRTWDWDYFILACEICQRHKWDLLPFDDNGHWMVNPRQDEPLHFLYFDYVTGLIKAKPTTETTRARGKVTIDRLGFDDRANLADMRRRKLLDVLQYMMGVIEASSEQESNSAWDHLIDHLRAESPYLGMIRQMIVTTGDYSPIVDSVRNLRPDFDDVIREWCAPIREPAANGIFADHKSV